MEGMELEIWPRRKGKPLSPDKEVCFGNALVAWIRISQGMMRWFRDVCLFYGKLSHDFVCL